QAFERRVDNRVCDLHSRASASVDLRPHRQLRRRALVEAAARAVPGVDHRVRYARSRAQAAFDFRETAGVRVLARADADNAFEAALEMIRAAAKPAREACERHVAIDIRQIHARAPDLVDPGIGRRGLVWAAAPA